VNRLKPDLLGVLTGGGRNCLIVGMREGVGMAEEVEVSDAIAVERTLAGDRDAYRVLVERHGRAVFRMAYRMTGNTHEAEEVVQESFVRGYQKLRQFAGNSNFGTWVYRIAANYAIDRIRKRKAEESRVVSSGRVDEDAPKADLMSQVADAGPSPERLAGSAQLAERMKAALETLSPAERTAIVMRHWDGCGIEEIAAVLKSNSNATKNTVFRAVQKLRKALEPFLESKARAMGTE
jgi:RNA polymerase sigma-70 factor, ECF subfamily